MSSRLQGIGTNDLLKLIDELVKLVEFECGMYTKGDEYWVPDEDDPKYEDFQMFMEWLIIIDKLYQQGKYCHLKHYVLLKKEDTT